MNIQLKYRSSVNIYKVIVYPQVELSLPRKVPRMHAAFPRWTAIDKRWTKERSRAWIIVTYEVI